jgi:adenine deaminase
MQARTIIVRPFVAWNKFQFLRGFWHNHLFGFASNIIVTLDSATTFCRERRGVCILVVYPQLQHRHHIQGTIKEDVVAIILAASPHSLKSTQSALITSMSTLDATMVAFIEGLPKCELHLHIEGTLEPEMVFELAKRNGKEVKFDSVEELREAYNFENLQSFLDLYYQGADILLHEQDFYDLAMAFFKKAHSEKIIHVEAFFDPQTHTDRGVDFKDVIMGLTRAKEDATKELGISVYFIMCFLKHLTEEQAIATLEQSLPYKHLIMGVGLDSTEMGNPPAKFEKVMRMSREAGYQLVSHAGEEGPPEYIRETIDLLDVDRIDHGIRSVEDDELVKRIAREQIPLTLCPLSNCKLCVIEKMEDFPLHALLEANVCATINSDDPAYFGGYLNENYKEITRALKLTMEDLQTLAKNGFKASFAPDTEKEKWNKMVDDYYHSFKK